MKGSLFNPVNPPPPRSPPYPWRLRFELFFHPWARDAMKLAACNGGVLIYVWGFYTIPGVPVQWISRFVGLRPDVYCSQLTMDWLIAHGLAVIIEANCVYAEKIAVSRIEP